MASSSFPYRLDTRESGWSSLLSLAPAERARIDALLLDHGAVLFESFDVDSVDKLEQCVGAFAKERLSYLDGNSPRTKLSDSVYTSTEYPSELSISLHNELSYSKTWPSRLYFCCAVAPATGGSTLIADSRALLRDMPHALRAKFEDKGVTYVRNLHSGSGVAIGKSWQKTFETESRSEVEAFCRKSDIRFEWKPDSGLRLTQVRPATTAHPVTGEKVWFNQLEQFHPSTNPPEVYEAINEFYGENPFDMPQYACFGDGTAITENELAQLRTVMESHTVAPVWKKGDMLVIDNVLTAHGRSPYTGARKVLVAMS